MVSHPTKDTFEVDALDENDYAEIGPGTAATNYPCKKDQLPNQGSSLATEDIGPKVDNNYDAPRKAVVNMDYVNDEPVYGNEGVSDKGIPVHKLLQYIQSMKRESQGFEREFKVWHIVVVCT